MSNSFKVNKFEGLKLTEMRAGMLHNMAITSRNPAAIDNTKFQSLKKFYSIQEIEEVAQNPQINYKKNIRLNSTLSQESPILSSNNDESFTQMLGETAPDDHLSPHSSTGIPPVKKPYSVLGSILKKRGIDSPHGVSRMVFTDNSVAVTPTNAVNEMKINLIPPPEEPSEKKSAESKPLAGYLFKKKI